MRLPLPTRLRDALRTIRYAGTAVRCPICGGRFRRFASMPGLPPVRCPRCGSLPRQRLLWLWLLGNELLAPGASILHFAPERGLAARLSAIDGLSYISADLEEGVGMVQADLTQLPFDDASFDVVLCSHVLEHIPDDRRAMTEIHRVLRSGGTALIQTPVNYDQPATFEDPDEADPLERLRRFSQIDHVRVYGPDLRDRLEQAGFQVQVIGAEDVADAGEFGLLPRWDVLRNDLYRCLKP